MEKLTRQPPPIADHRPALGRPRPRRRAFFLLVAGTYGLIILALALIGSSQLYEWGYKRTYRGGFASPPPLAEQQAAPAPVLEGSAEQVTPTPATGQPIASGDAALSMPEQSISVLLLGVDARPDERDAPRTDTMILLTLDPGSHTAGMLSLPRDMWVPIPGYDVTTKINSAYTIGEHRDYPGGGPQLSKDTVSAFIGRPVDYYLRINFDGFVEIIDLIGGVDLLVPKTIHDELYPTADYGYQTFHIDAGPQHLDGERALMYARTRNTDNDYSRAGRQQQVIQAVLDKLLSSAMIPTLISKVPHLLGALRDSVATDIPLPLAVSLAHYMSQHSLAETRQLVLDSRFGSESYTDDGLWILLPNREQTRAALADFFAQPSSSLQLAAGSAAHLAQPLTLLPPTDQRSVRIEILNGSGHPGVAARAQELLATHGWNIVAIGTADRLDYRRTLIVNYRTPEALVERASADLSIQPTVSRLAGLNHAAAIDLRIIIGQDYVKNVLNE